MHGPVSALVKEFYLPRWTQVFVSVDDLVLGKPNNKSCGIWTDIKVFKYWKPLIVTMQLISILLTMSLPASLLICHYNKIVVVVFN